MLNDDLISAYIDGELDAERRAFVEHHLRTDSGARARLDRMRAVDGALRNAFRLEQRANDPLIAAAVRSSGARPAQYWAMRSAALAAALALGLFVGRFVGEPQPYSISRAEARLLDTLPSGASANVNGDQFEPMLSVRNEAGGFCRQFRLTGAAERTDVLACRGEQGAWRMVVAAPAVAAGAYAVAGANSPIDAALESLGAAEALDAAQEREAIARGWR